MNSRGWKSFSILSIRMISSLFTNLLNSVSRLFETFVNLSSVLLISRFSFLISFMSSSVDCLDDIRFFPRSRTRSLISRFLSLMSLSRVLKSDKRNCIWLSAS